VTYIAQFTPITNKYKVTFVDEDGITVIKVDQSDTNDYREYDYGTAAVDIAKPADPTKDPDDQYTYTFAGWSPAVTEVTEDVTYTATYSSTVNQYTVTFIDWNGVVLKAATAYDYGTLAADIAKPADPTRVGYTFVGWNGIPATMPAQSVTVTATYNINEYTVSFDTNGGSAAPASQTVNYNSTATAPANPTKDGYTFLGWFAE
jgi:uncharacterized repeat protein (TIGR02543 family)